MSNLDAILEFYPDEEFLKADGFDDAVIGVSFDKSVGAIKLVYSRSKCINVLIERDGMSFEDAMEYFDFNVDGAYVGENTPIFMDDEMFNVIFVKNFDDIE